MTYRGVYSRGLVEAEGGVTTRSLPDFMASIHFKFATRLTAFTKAGCRNASKLWLSVRDKIWCREVILW